MRFLSLVCLALLAGCSTTPLENGGRPPNIVYLYADDLGIGEIGPYGQRTIRTPTLDRLAAEGMLFTQHYSGSAVCAPSRAVLLTGKHTGHAFIRDNKELGGWGPDEPEGQWPLAADEVTLAERLRQAGYVTGAMGKWGLGGPDGEGHPNLQGFDLFYGYLCQRVAHNYYPTHLWRNGDKEMLPGNDYFAAHQRIDAPPDDPSGYEQYRGETYAPDRMGEAALQFIRDSADRPFFLYFPTIVPHVAIQVPEDSLAQYGGRLDEAPYLGQEGYLPHPEPRAAYAAMITRMDRDLGRIVDLIDELGLADTTLILFSSDNGPTYAGGADSEFFESAAELRGLKGQLYEGGIRAPMIARWPGHIEAGSTSNHVSAQWDVLPTVLEIAGLDAQDGVDGRSFAPTLLGRSKQARHGYLYWELLRFADEAGELRVELYDLAADHPAETTDLAESRPDRVQQLLTMAHEARTPSELFPSAFDGR